jgi:deoxyribodipyrimidine photo-lyase
VKSARSQQANAESSSGLSTWISELIWREFYRHVLVNFPHVCRNQNFDPRKDAVQWRDDEDGYQAWCQGRTGIPFVDAAMRCLVATGWMHNRLRMVSSQFLSKHLLIDWRRGEEFFARHLVDIDFASNNGGWQWSASTGTDAAPYFRIFNPVLQGQRFDPKGTFTRRWVPELDALRNKDLHDPWRRCATESRKAGYPAPIVDLALGRTRAIEAFQAVFNSAAT